jgi:hypothetical protein
MLALKLVGYSLAYGFFTWASKEINPMHDDVGLVMQRRLYWSEKLRSLE